MNIFKKALTLLFLVIQISNVSNAQISINSDGSSPDASAMLEITSSDKGILIPRMTTVERIAIVSPAIGLMVYDSDENSFWYYNGSAWTAVGENNSGFTSENGSTISTNNDDDFVFGADSLNWASGNEYKFFFDKSKGAFRAGGIISDTWDEANLGNYSTAFGFSTIASGSVSTAFGFSTIASGEFSTVFGISTEAFSHTEVVMGAYNTTYTPNSTTSFNSADRLFVIGNGQGPGALSDAMIVYKSGNTEINGDLTVSGTLTGGAFISENGSTISTNNDDDFVFGADSLNYGTGLEYKMFFDKSLGAFRVGNVNGDKWDENNIGEYSFAAGHNTKASGFCSVALGTNSIASGYYSTAFSIGTASNYYATAFSQSTASGEYSTAFSDGTASGKSATAFSGTASNYYATAFSQGSASGKYSTAFSDGTASGDYATAFGSNTTSKSYGEFAIGFYNTDYIVNDTSNFDSLDRLFVIGNGTSSATSDAMIVYKSGNTEINGDLTVTGSITANNTAFISENDVTYSSNSDDDFVIGTDSLNYGTGIEYKFFFDKERGAIRGGRVENNNWDNDSLGIGSLGIGYNSLAIGNYSVALGREVVASGINSVALGRYTEAPSYAETAIGVYNTTYTPNSTNSINSDDRLFVIGNGTSATRSDAMIVYKDGSAWIQGDLTVDATLYTSDIRLKENITTSQYGLEDILNIKVRDYEFKKDTTNHLHTGFLAQQLHTVFPHAVHKGGEDENTNPWSVDYASLTPLLVKGMQEQQEIIDKLTMENGQLIMENEIQNKRLQALEKQVSAVETLKQQNAEMKAMLEQIQVQLNANTNSN